MTSLRALITCVDYSDLLALTLPYNRHHFDEVLVVTSNADANNLRYLCDAYGVDIFVTNSFYADGASFNKWKALEEGLDAFGRHGWLCLLDADVLWPKDLKGWTPTSGCIHTPLRHMHVDLRQTFPHHGVGEVPSDWRLYPPEPVWWEFPIHRNIYEWAGYTQIFQADDPVLGKPPWHEIDWKHAGGADSAFQARWSVLNKLRPPWNVMHLGPTGENWCGRATPYTDGSLPTTSKERTMQLHYFLHNRKAGPDRHRHEKL